MLTFSVSRLGNNCLSIRQLEKERRLHAHTNIGSPAMQYSPRITWDDLTPFRWWWYVRTCVRKVGKWVTAISQYVSQYGCMLPKPYSQSIIVVRDLCYAIAACCLIKILFSHKCMGSLTRLSCYAILYSYTYKNDMYFRRGRISWRVVL